MADQPSVLGEMPQCSKYNSPTISNVDANVDADTSANGNSVGATKDTMMSSEVSFPYYLHHDYIQEGTLRKQIKILDRWGPRSDLLEAFNSPSKFAECQYHETPANRFTEQYYNLYSMPIDSTDTTTDASAAMENVQNHPTTQSAKDALQNGPIAESVKDHAAKTGSDFQGLADSRASPSQSASTGQPLTHYHSFFYSLLSWEHPRATAITFAATIAFIFAARYLPILRWVMKACYVVFGITAAAEILGKTVMSQGLASSFRPRRYYTIPKEVLERSLDDVEQLINFFVIEFQRVLFAEKPIHTILAFLSSLVTYFLIKFTPLWGLFLIATTVTFLGPLIYMENQELIDHHVSNAHNVVNQQAAQVRDLAGQHTSKAAGTMKQYAGDYTNKAQEYIGNKRGTSPTLGKKQADFPAVPKQEPVGEQTNNSEPIAAS